MSDVPEELRRDVITEVYCRADQLDWDGLSQRDRSEHYDRWLDEPGIGRVLTRFMTRERARVWLKDVPMKQYTRARSGVGPYAALVARPLPGPNETAGQVFGAGWSVVDGTIREKPNRCVVSDGRNSLLMIWGNPSNLRALVWSAINAVVDELPTPVVVITTTQAQKLSQGEMDRHRRIAEQIGIAVRYTVLREC